MTWKKLSEDSFLLGIAAGTGMMIFNYFIITCFRMFVSEYTGNLYFMAPPMVQFIVILINILAFRYLVLKLDREQTARGLLLITLIASFIYFYIFFRLHHKQY